MDSLTRLDKLYYRLQAQHVCLAWVFRAIEYQPGIVFELGLGHGRTYDHLRTHLPGRDIYVFDREVDCIPDCTPPDDRLFLGDIGDTLAVAGRRFAGKVVFAHADMGSYGEDHNRAMSALLSRLLPAVLVPGAIVLSDLPLALTGAFAQPLPEGARADRYFLYRLGEV